MVDASQLPCDTWISWTPPRTTLGGQQRRHEECLLTAVAEADQMGDLDPQFVEDPNRIRASSR